MIMQRLFSRLLAFATMICLICFSDSYQIEQLIHPQIIKVNTDVQYSDNLKENQTIAQFLIDVKYSGRYISQQQQRIFDYIDSQQGVIDLFFEQNLERGYNNTNLKPNVVIIYLFDPQFKDEKVVGFQFPIQKIDENSTWIGNVDKVNVTMFYKQSAQQQKQFNNLTYKIIAQGLQTRDVEQIKLQIEINGPYMNFKASLTYYNNLLPNLGYALFSTFLVSIQIICGVFLIQSMQVLNFSFAAKLSLITLGICAIEDFNMAMIHIQEIMNLTGQYFLFLLPSFAYVVLVVAIDMRMIFGSWRGHNMRAMLDFRELRKKLTLFYLKFYLGLFGYMVLLYFFGYDAWFIVIQNLYLIPQIIRNVRKGVDPGFSYLYTFGFIGTRFILIIYFRACPGNYFKLVPLPWVVISVSLIYLFCVIVMYAQHKVGARFFIPKTWQPNYFQYYCEIERSQLNKQLQCLICLQNIFEEENSLNTSHLQDNLLNRVKVMKTPCNHIFHQSCLKEWISVKLQCPTCRNQLPILL